MFAVWAFLRASKAARWVAIAFAAISAFMIALARAKRQGRKEAMEDAREADHARAEDIRRTADEVRRAHDGMSDDDVDDWLHDHSSRRD